MYLQSHVPGWRHVFLSPLLMTNYSADPTPGGFGPNRYLPVSLSATPASLHSEWLLGFLSSFLLSVIAAQFGECEALEAVLIM